MGRKLIKMIGRQFQSWTVIEEAPLQSANNRRWLCQCVCGTQQTFNGKSLRFGNNARDCGCIKGSIKIYAPTRRTWNSMKARCNNPRYPAFPAYGGRGIKICPQWGEFSVFLRDMGERPPGKTLDRRDNNKGYSPENCCWSTMEEQANNRRDNVRLTFRGKTLTIAQWAREIGVGRTTLFTRLRAQWPLELALTAPKHFVYRKRITKR